MASRGLSRGAALRAAIKDSAKGPLQIVGAINAYAAMQAASVGHRAIYLSGGGVAAASHGLPDLGITTLDDVVAEAKKITSACSLPLLVDIDTGFGASAFSIQRTIADLERVSVAGVHMEDQVAQKRCGHRPGKQIVSTGEMVDRIKAAVSGRSDPDFLIMARTDALANEGMESAMERCRAYVAAGADALFPEAFTSLDQYKSLSAALPDVPILANITEFGKTPLFTTAELGSVGVSMVLYPLSAFRAMAAAALKVYKTIASDGTQAAVVDSMQTRADLYTTLNYHYYEDFLDKTFAAAAADSNKDSKSTAGKPSPAKRSRTK